MNEWLGQPTLDLFLDYGFVREPYSSLRGKFLSGWKSNFSINTVTGSGLTLSGAERFPSAPLSLLWEGDTMWLSLLSLLSLLEDLLESSVHTRYLLKWS